MSFEAIDKNGDAVRHIWPPEAATLIETGNVDVLDVRTPGEYERLGHVPGAWLLPVDLVASAPAVLPPGDRPVLVVCEHGIRSQRAATVLARAGRSVFNMLGGMSAWTGSRAFGPGERRGPAEWLLENADLLPRGGAALDVACGRGRHALLLASTGFSVRAIDADASRVQELRDIAARLGLDVNAAVVDLEHGDADLGDASFDLAIVVHYLHRPLMPAITRALRPGGVLVYETYTVDQAARGRPTSPAHLLHHGELRQLVAPLTVLRERDGEVSGRLVASIVARKEG